MAGGALSKDPGQKKVAANGGKKLQTGGALSMDPNIAALQKKRQAVIQQIQAKGGKEAAPGLTKRLGNISSQIHGLKKGTTTTDPSQTQGPTDTGPTLDSVTGESNGVLSDIFGRIQDQGAFNPGDFGDQMQQAQDSVMNDFNRRMNPVFQQQNQDKAQQLAEQGIDYSDDPNSRYQREMRSMQQSQTDARQGAMNQAVQLGQQVQNQGWNQAFQGYQLPTMQLSAMSPFYNAQMQAQMQGNQQTWQAGQNANDWANQFKMAKLNNRFALQQIAATPHGGGGGGGGMSMNDRYALMDREFYNNLVLSQMQNGGGKGTNPLLTGATAGIATGTTAGLASGLK